jgi:hypothetical protein
LNSSLRLCLAAACFAAGFIALLAPVPVRAGATAAPSASPSVSASPSPTPGPVSDPCTSLSNLVSRPSFSTSACAVKPNDLLIESGYSNTTAQGTGATSTISFPQATLRLGLAHDFEVDVATPSYERQSSSPKISGTSDSGLGLKYEIGYTSKVTYGVNALYTLDTGSAGFSGNGNGILANVNGALTLSPAVGLFGSFGYNAQSAGTALAQQRYHGFDPSLGVSVSLPQSFSIFAEGFGMSSTGPGLGGRYAFDTGILKDVGSRLQLDAEYYDYPGYQNGTRQASVGFGASYLFGP